VPPDTRTVPVTPKALWGLEVLIPDRLFELLQNKFCDPANAPLELNCVCPDDPAGEKLVLAQDGVLPFVVKYLPEFPDCDGKAPTVL
jgi:hypothetical protein